MDAITGRKWGPFDYARWNDRSQLLVGGWFEYARIGRMWSVRAGRLYLVGIGWRARLSMIGVEE